MPAVKRLLLLTLLIGGLAAAQTPEELYQEYITPETQAILDRFEEAERQTQEAEEAARTKKTLALAQEIMTAQGVYDEYGDYGTDEVNAALLAALATAKDMLRTQPLLTEQTAMVNTLKAAEEALMGCYTPLTDEGYVDMTASIQNASFEAGSLKNWTATSSVVNKITTTLANYMSGADGSYVAKLNSGGSISQTLTGLKNGTYLMKVLVGADYNNHITVSAGELSTTVEATDFGPMYLEEVVIDNIQVTDGTLTIVAKHMPPDKDGVRIAELDERSYRELLWDHRPLTDFWRIGRGIARRLEANGMFTQGDIARCSVGKAHERHNANLLYKLFGVNAELIIDHAWGWEPCTIADVKAYKPQSRSVSSGQVLFRPYRFDEAALIVREMTDGLVLDLVDKGLQTDQLVLSIGYDAENVRKKPDGTAFSGTVERDWYGRDVPRGTHGSWNFGGYTASSREITRAAVELFSRIADPELTVRRITITANRVRTEEELSAEPRQLSLFVTEEEQTRQEQDAEREKRRQQAILALKKRFGKNAVVKAMNLQEAGTAMERNEQIGGHKG